jgi:hypothetical protein
VAAGGSLVGGYTKHGLNRAIGDGLGVQGTSIKAILDALKDPTKVTSGIDDLGRSFTKYRGKDAIVVINPTTGNIISAIPKSTFGVR